MFQQIVNWSRALLKRIFGRGSDDGIGEVAAEPETVNVEFVNLTSIDIDLHQLDDDGVTRRFATVGRGSSHRQDAVVGSRWSLTDPSGRVELATATADVDGQRVAVDETRVRADHDLVTIEFRNSTEFEVDLFRIAADGREDLVTSCDAGCYVRSPDADPTTPWRIRTREHGAVLRSFIPTLEATQRCEIDNTLIGFENHSFVDVEVRRIDIDGSTTVVARLAPMEFVVAANFAAWEWTVVEPRSGREMASAPSTTRPVTIEVGEQRLAEPTTGDDVELTLSNGNGFDVVVERVQPTEAALRNVSLGAGEGLVVEARSGTAWRFRERYTSTEVDLYVSTGASFEEHRTQLRSRSSTVHAAFDVVNETPLTLELAWVDFDGREEAWEELPAHGQSRIESWVTHAWVLRDRHSKTVVAARVAQRETPAMRVAASSIHGVDGRVPVEIVWENATPFRVDVLSIGTDGTRRPSGHLDPDESRVEQSAAGTAWEFRKHLSGEVVGMFIASDAAAQSHSVRLASVRSSVATTVEFVNRTPLTIDVHWVDFDGVEAPASHTLARGSVATIDTYVGASWVARDRHSGEVIGGAIGRAAAQSVDLTSEHLRSLTSQQQVDVSFVNASHLDTEVFWIDYRGELVSYGPLAPGESKVLESFATHPFRIKSPAFDAEVGLFVVGHEPSERYEITSDLVAAAPAGTTPTSGQVALYEQPDYGGTVWLIDTTAFDLGAIPELERVRSVRVGPSTGVTLYRGTGLTGDEVDLYMDAPKLEGTPLADGDVGSLKLWRLFTPKQAGISSRSTLVEDRRMTGPDTVGKYMNYRTILKVPTSVSEIDISATVACTFDVGGDTHHYDGRTPVRVTPNAMSRVVINTEATGLSTPPMFIRTNTMPADARIPIFRDAPAHHNVTRLRPGALHAARSQLGISAPLTEEQSAHLQTALMNVAGTVQYTYHPSPHGVHHKRQISAANMEHPHWTLDLADQRPSYRPLRHDEVAGVTAGARPLDAATASGILDDFVDLGRVTMHTVHNVGHDLAETGKHVVGDVVKTADNVGRHVIGTVHRVGEDLKNGDVVGAMGDVRDGTISVGHDLATGAKQVSNDLAHGAKAVAGDVSQGVAKLVVVTLHFADDAVQLVLDGVEAVGEIIGKILDKIGAALEKFIAWIAELLGWDDVLHTHRVLGQSIERGVDDLERWVGGLEHDVDRFFVSLEDDVRAELDHALPHSTPAARTKHDALAAEFNHAIEKVEWFMSLVADHVESSTETVASDLFGSEMEGPIASFVATTRQAMGDDNKHVDAALSSIFADIAELFADPHVSVDDINFAIHDMVTTAVDTTLELANALADALLELLRSMLDGIRRSFDEPLEIPLLEDLFGVISPGEPFNLKNATTLVIALPTTIYAKAVDHRPPFAEVAVAGQLKPLTTPVRDWGHVYGITHVIQGVVSTIDDGLRAAKAVAGAKAAKAAKARANSRYEMTDVSDWGSPAQNGPSYELESLGTESAPTAAMSALSVIDSLLGLVDQISGNPTGRPHEFVPIVLSAAGDADRAPSEFWAPTIWYYQWAMWLADAIAAGFGVFATVRGGTAATAWVDKAITYARPAIGVIQCAGMVGLVVADDTRYGHLGKVKAGGTALSSDEQNFVDWHDQGGQRLKALTNIMDTVPTIGQLGFVPAVIEATDGISAAVAAGLDLVGHETEGIGYIVRTNQNGLL